jgi:hypothetical protein
MLEIIIPVVYVCVAFFVMGVIGGLGDGEFDGSTFALGLLWPITIVVLLGVSILFGLMYLGKKIGEWIGDRLWVIRIKNIFLYEKEEIFMKTIWEKLLNTTWEMGKLTSGIMYWADGFGKLLGTKDIEKDAEFVADMEDLYKRVEDLWSHMYELDKKYTSKYLWKDKR